MVYVGLYDFRLMLGDVLGRVGIKQLDLLVGDHLFVGGDALTQRTQVQRGGHGGLALFAQHEINKLLRSFHMGSALDDLHGLAGEDGAFHSIDNLDRLLALGLQLHAGILIAQTHGIFAIGYAIVNLRRGGSGLAIQIDQELIDKVPGFLAHRIAIAHAVEHADQALESGGGVGGVGADDLALQFGLDQIGIAVHFNAHFGQQLGVDDHDVGFGISIIKAVGAIVLEQRNQRVVFGGYVHLEQIAVGGQHGFVRSPVDIHGDVAGFHFALYALQHFAGGAGDHFYLDAGLGFKGGDYDVVQAFIAGAVNHQRFAISQGNAAHAQQRKRKNKSQQFLHFQKTAFHIWAFLAHL